MTAERSTTSWQPGHARIAVVMISLNESHNMEAVLDNLEGWAAEVFLVDSYSADDTVNIALSKGVHVVQRRFGGFGDQWNFALDKLPIKAPWTMKLDPDERLTDELKRNIVSALASDDADALIVRRKLWFMGRALPIEQPLLRLWRTGTCRFSDVLVNEHPIVKGRTREVVGVLEHHDSPDLTHWYDKQNKYSTAEAKMTFQNRALAATPTLFGSSLQRRMWLKKNFDRLPMRFTAVFVYYFLVAGLWRAGWVGWAWSHLRSEVYRMRFYKLREMQLSSASSRAHETRVFGHGEPDPRVRQFD